MKWFSREKMKVDHVACPWLIRKFIDPKVGFLFAPAPEIEGRAAELNALDAESQRRAVQNRILPPEMRAARNYLF